MMKKTTNTHAATVLALLMALLLASLPLAANAETQEISGTSGAPTTGTLGDGYALLDELFGGETPGEEAVRLLQRDVDSASENGVTLSVDELLFDGRSVNVRFTTASEREGAVFMTAAVRLSGMDMEAMLTDFREMSYSTGVNDGMLLMLGEQGGVNAPIRTTQGVRFSAPMPVRQPAALEITVRAWRTDLVPVVVGDEYPEDSEAMEGNGQIGVYENAEGNRSAWLPDYPSVQKAMEQSREEDEIAAVMEAIGGSGLMEEVAALTLRVPLKAGEYSLVTFGPRTFEMEDCTLEVLEVSFSAAATMMDLLVTTRGKAGESDFFGYRFLATAGGEAWLLNLDGEIEAVGDGRMRFLSKMFGLPVARIPEEICFIRVDARREGETYQAHYRRLIREAPEESRAVFRLGE